MIYRALVLITAIALGSATSHVLAQQTNAEPIEPALLGNDGIIMPPVSDDAYIPPSDAPSIDDTAPEQADDGVTLKLVTRGIYQCTDGSRSVFVDEENRTKYGKCKQIRAPYYEQIVDDNLADQTRSPCSGAILYQGSTYVFNDQEPCPIPEEIFEARKPIEANPEYYTQPQP